MERGEVDRPAAAVHPAHGNTPPTPPPPFINRWGSLDGGAGNAQRRTTSQQQQQSRTLPATTPLASQAGGVPAGLTVSAQARNAFDLYSQCVGAGQWSKLVIEQRSDGEHISLHSRPMAAAVSIAAAPAGRPRKKRRPNQKRLERQQRRRVQRSERRQQEPARHVPSDRQQATASSSPATYTPTPAAAVTSDSLRAVPSYAAVAASPPRLTAARSSLVPSPRLTRAAKKRRGCSSPGDETAIVQLDGADNTPPSSPPEPLTPEVSPAGGVGSPTAPTSPPLPPPPWHVGSPTAPTCPPSYADAAHVPPPARQPVKIVAEKIRMVICQVCNLKKHIPGQRCCIKCMSEGH